MSSCRSRRSASFGLVAALATLIGSSAFAAEERPTLVVVGTSPVVVEGRGFGAKERVTVRATFAGQAVKQTVRADADGRFTAQLTELNAECQPFRVSAAGHRGSRAVTPRSVPAPCGMQIQP